MNKGASVSHEIEMWGVSCSIQEINLLFREIFFNPGCSQAAGAPCVEPGRTAARRWLARRPSSRNCSIAVRPTGSDARSRRRGRHRVGKSRPTRHLHPANAGRKCRPLPTRPACRHFRRQMPTVGGPLLLHHARNKSGVTTGGTVRARRDPRPDPVERPVIRLYRRLAPGPADPNRTAVARVGA